MGSFHDWGGTMLRSRLPVVAGAVLAIEGVVFGGLTAAGWVSGALAGTAMGCTALMSGLSAAFGGSRATP